MSIKTLFKCLVILGTFGAVSQCAFAQSTDSAVPSQASLLSSALLIAQPSLTSLQLRAEMAMQSPSDSGHSSHVASTDTGKTQQSGTMSMTKSPGTALVRSLVCPGWGQLYDENYFRAALFFGATATVTGILLWNNAKYLNADATYSSSASTDVQKQQAYVEREFYRDQRDVSGLWLLGIYTLSAIDAYVGAHLYDFDVSDKGLSLLPVMNPGGASLCAVVRF